MIKFNIKTVDTEKLGAKTQNCIRQAGGAHEIRVPLQNTITTIRVSYSIYG
jgi:hypothetical protein